MQFVAKRLDLSIEVEALDGTKKDLKLAAPLSADVASKLLDRIIAEEKAFRDASTTTDAEGKQNYSKDLYGQSVAFLDKQLSDIYATEPGFWSNNFDKTTLIEIKQYVLDELMGLRKK